MKKKLHIIMMSMALCFIFAFSAKVNAADLSSELKPGAASTQAKAGISAFPSDAVKVNAYSSQNGAAGYTVKKISGAVGVQVQLLSYQKKPLASNKGYFNGVKSGNIYTYKGVKSDRYFYYKARAIYLNSKGNEYYGGWSKLKAFSTLTAKLKFAGAYKEKITMPTISGVTKYDIFVSAKNKDTGFKKVASLKPGKSMVLAQYQGKSFKSYGNNHKFYVFIKPYLSSGASMFGVYDKMYFYFYTTYK